jgi:glycosyltransferase involved in cell wall biosynthesis
MSIPNEPSPGAHKSQSVAPAAGAPTGGKPEPTAETRRPPRRLALVLWNGNIGGAEVFNVALARRMRRLGLEATIVFVGDSQPLAARLLDSDDVPYRTLGLSRGYEIIAHPRLYAAEIAKAGPDGALLVSCGFMGATLRLGGYRGPIVAVEHGDVLEARFYSQRKRLLRWISRLGGVWADDMEIAVSDFVLERLRQQPHTRKVKRIYNGIDPEQYASGEGSAGHAEECVVGFAGRLVFGKGADHLIEAVARVSSEARIRLLIAGDGPERSRLESLAHSLGVDDAVSFLGLEHDMPAFWQVCDVAAMPSTEFIESCPMTTLEAMASGKPIVATENGGLPELVIDAKTGIVVPPHNTLALSEALTFYAHNRDIAKLHGAAGRDRVVEHFHIGNCAQAYLALFDELALGTVAKSPATT